MSWYNPFSWNDDSNDKNTQLHQQLSDQAKQASDFGSTMANGLGGYNAGLDQQLQYLQGQELGKNSVSAEQLRQGLQQQVAQQQSVAASASPQNATMAARNAANNMGRASYGMSGQAAVVGLQERNQAAQALSNALLQARGQNIQGANSAYGTATSGYGAGVANPYQSWAQQNAALLSAGASGAGAIAASDKRLKKDVEDGDDKSKTILKGLRSYSFSYKDPKFGDGPQFGVMAQDLEKSGLGHAVMDTPSGKMVHAGKAATAGLALVAALAKRVDELENRGADED